MPRGFSLIELTTAMAVLAVGLLGGVVVVVMSTANDGRSKLHTTAVNLARGTMEKILAIPANATGAAAQTKITDCAGNVFTIETAPGGSGLINSGAFAGTVDFSQPTLTNYSMRYIMCSTGGAVAYDVRWRVDAGPTLATQLVTVSAKPGSGNQRMPVAQFTLPSTLHQIRGNF
jgi:prepilin-type N-terminal cleavage/methylation domain-containing protein